MTAPVILAIDTATELCSVAVLHAGLVERTEEVGQKHSDRVLPFVDAVLREAELRLRDVDAFAFGAGPGSFTGLRIACGVVQGLAYASGRPVVAIGNLRALAALRWPGTRAVPRWWRSTPACTRRTAVCIATTTTYRNSGRPR